MAQLPVELWLLIFRWATISLLTPRLRSTTYHPFQTAVIGVQDEALKTKCTLVLVCKQWRLLVQSLFYEDFCMTPDILEDFQSDGAERAMEKGRYIRRACLPYTSTVTRSRDPLKAAEVLQICPHLEVLVRGPHRNVDDSLRFDFPSQCPPLMSLKRLDWWHCNEAARSGGINSLADVISAAPNLQYISLGGDLLLSLMRVSPIELPSLTTLRLRRMSVLFIQQVCRWEMPALTHVIIDTVSNPCMLESFWQTFGPQIQVLELGVSLKYYVSDALSLFLPVCPNLQELNYYVHFTIQPRPLYNQHLSLTTIGMHALSNSFFPVGSAPYWEHVEEHFAVYCRPSFPALKRIILYGNWGPVLNDARSISLLKPLRDRGYLVEWHKD